MSPYAKRVLDLVERIPHGRVLAYGDVAELLGGGGPRQVAAVMARHGAEVAWHRVLRADGTCAPQVAARQLPQLRRERVPMTADGARVLMVKARWVPAENDIIVR